VDGTLTDFVVDAAVVEAERVLADRTQFVLGAEQWERFVELLDRRRRTNRGSRSFLQVERLRGRIAA
jgi:uncharacterized protein (DUF1778 family)